LKTVGAQHENRRAAMFVDEDCVDSRSDVDDLGTCDCLYDESRQVTYDSKIRKRSYQAQRKRLQRICAIYRWFLLYFPTITNSIQQLLQ